MRKWNEPLAVSAVLFWLLASLVVGASAGWILDLFRDLIVVVGTRMAVPLPALVTSIWFLYLGLPLLVTTVMAGLLVRWPPSFLLRTPVPDSAFALVGVFGVFSFAIAFPFTEWLGVHVVWNQVSTRVFGACAMASYQASVLAMAIVGTALSFGVLAAVRSYRRWKWGV